MLISRAKWIGVVVCILLALFWYASGWARVQDGHKVHWAEPEMPQWYSWLFVASAVATILLWHAEPRDRTCDPRGLGLALLESLLAATFVFLLVAVLLPPMTPGCSPALQAWANWSWVPGAVLAIGAGAAVARWRYKVLPDDEPRCTKCGYLLRGLTEPRCPECGTGFDSRQLHEEETH